MKFSDVKDLIATRLVGTRWEGVYIHAGPDDEQTPPGRFVMLTLIGGPGLNTEALFDGRSYQVMVAGEQGSFEDSEDLAYMIDSILINLYSQSIGGTWVTGVVRQGGPPTPLSVDDAERTRFTCNYIFDVRSAVA